MCMAAQSHKAKTQKLAERMLKIAMQLIEKHKSKDSGPVVDGDKLNLMDILILQEMTSFGITPWLLFSLQAPPIPLFNRLASQHTPKKGLLTS